MNSPLVSVIVPNYNHARFLNQRMDSILKQTFSDFEVIILDDASTDNSKDIIEHYRSYPQVKQIILNEVNSGSPFAQWQKGMESSGGQYLWIAESDDFVSPDFLETALKHLDSPLIDLFYCRSVVVDEQGNEHGNMSAWYGDLTSDLDADYEMTGDDELTRHLFYKNTIVNASSVVFRRVPRINGFLHKIKSMHYCGDWLFWMMYCDGAAGVAYSTTPTNYFRSHSGVTRKERNYAQRNAEMIQVLRYILQHELSKGYRTAILKYFQQQHMVIRSRRSIGWNLNLALKQCMISPVSLGWWTRYYLTGVAK